MALKDLDRRFGNIAMKKGFVTMEQLINALSVQVMEEMESGVRKLIGHILHEQGQITETQLEEVLKELMATRNEEPTRGQPHELFGAKLRLK